MLFADLVDSTAITRNMDPEEADDLLSRLFASFEQIVVAHEGSVEKYIGDAMVAVFGVPVIHEDDGERAVHSAVLISRELREFNRRNPAITGSAMDSPGLQIRIGIHSGLITTGTRGKFEVVTGPTMNIAARVQAEAEPGEILVTAATAENCSADIIFGEARRRMLKGLDEPLDVYPVSRGTGIARPRPAFYGRQDIVRRCVQNYFLKHNELNRGVLLIGETGMGKSETIQQILQEMEQLPGFTGPVLYSKARKFRRVPYIVIVDFIANYFGLSPDMSEAELVQAMCNSSSGIAISERPAAARFARFYRDRTGATLREEAYSIVDEIFRTILESSKDSNQVVLVIDNAEDIDRKSSDYLKFFASSSDFTPMYIACSRSSDASVNLPEGFQIISLPPLSQTESRQLITSLLPDAQEQLITAIINRSNGIPLYIQSFARYILRNVPLVPGDSADPGEDMPVIALPENIQNIILSRIESLPPEIREIAGKLSAFVSFFTQEDLEYLLSVSSGTSHENLSPDEAAQILLREDIITQDRGLYFFRHEVVKQALYDSLLNHNKRILHAMIASRMEEQENPHPVRLLHHLVNSHQLSRALSHMAGSKARAFSMEFIPYLENIEQMTLQSGAASDLDETERETSRLDIQFMKARILFNNGFVHEADEIILDMIRYSVEQRNHLYAAVAFHILSAYNIRSYRFDKGVFCAVRAIRQYELTDAAEYALHKGLISPDGSAAVSAMRGLLVQAEVQRGNFETAGKLMQELQTGDATFHRVNSGLYAAIMKSEYGEAEQLIREYQSTVQDAENIVQHYRAPLAFLMGKWHELGTLSDTLLGSNHRDSATRVMGYTYRALNLWLENPTNGEIQELLDQSAFRTSRSPNSFDLIAGKTLRCEVLFIMGRIDEALNEGAEGLILAQRHSAYRDLFTLLILMNELHITGGTGEEGRFFLDDALTLLGLPYPYRRRDVISCRYFAGDDLRGCGFDIPAEREHSSCEDLARDEFDQFAEASDFENFVSSRCFTEIFSSLGVGNLK